LIIAIFPLRTGAAEPHWSGTISYIVENDVFHDVDRHYTNGMGVVWVPGRDRPAPDWVMRLARLVPWFPDQGAVRHGYAIGQSAFTPDDTDATDPPLTDRPYAGWLFGTVGVGTRTGNQLDMLVLSAGMVGPASLAEPTQKLIHKIVDASEPQGWDTQLGNEPGLMATYQRSWRMPAARTLIGNQLDLTPHLGATIGNVYTHGNAGLTLRYGQSLPDDFGPPRIQPGLLSSGEFTPPADGFNWYVFAGVEGRVVARNIFLDGNTFRDSRSVEKEKLISDLQFGLVLDWKDIRVSYTHVLRTPEFKGQIEDDDFGAFTVSMKY
jgi:hypothetical protein